MLRRWNDFGGWYSIWSSQHTTWCSFLFFGFHCVNNVMYIIIPYIFPILPRILISTLLEKPIIRKMGIPEIPRPQRIRYSLPAVLMRAGTSKGLFIHRHHMPPDRKKWEAVLLAAMGSRDGDQNQIDGVGGATSTTSKVAIVSKSNRPDADVDYTFVQVAVGEGKLDFSGNCGNMASGVGPFALDEGLVKAKSGHSEISIRIFNTNTACLLIATIVVSPDGYFHEAGDYAISGVLGTGSEIKLIFLNPAGSMTGPLFPTSFKKEQLWIPSCASLGKFAVTATLINAANPFIFVDSQSLASIYHHLESSRAQSLDLIETIRREGAVRFSLATDVNAAGQVRGTPKIAILSCPEDDKADIEVLAYSMGKPHPTLQLTGAVALGVAVCVEGSVACDLAPRRDDYVNLPGTPASDTDEKIGEGDIDGERVVRIRHGGGVICVVVKMSVDDEAGERVEKVTVSRTARRLFEGNVLVTL